MFAIVLAQLAQPRAEPITVEVTGEGCPSESELRAEAERRVGERRDPARGLSMRVKGSNESFSATVEVVGKNGTTTASRTIEGATCEGVANAALLLVALGSTDAAEAPANGGGAQPTTSASVEPPKVVSDEASSAAIQQPSRTRTTFHATLLSTFIGGAGPVAVGGGVRIAGAKEGAGLFRPEVALGLDGFLDATVERSSGQASRSLMAGRADLCPLGIGPRSVVIRVCAAGALGEIRVRGENVPRTKDEGRLYSALGGAVRARARIAGGLGIELAAGFLAPVQAHRFYFEPNETVVALASAPFAEGGLSWSIP